MLRKLSASLAALALTSTAALASLTGYWDFESNPTTDVISGTAGTFNSNAGLSGVAGGEGDANWSSNSFSSDGSTNSYFDTGLTGDSGSLDLDGAGAKTVVAWFRSTSVDAWNDNARYGIWSYSPGSGALLGGDLRLLIDEDAGGLRFEVSGGFAAVDTNLDDTLWHMAAVVIEAGDTDATLQIYLDGDFVALTSTSPNNRPINTLSDTTGLNGQLVGPTFIIGGDHRTDNIDEGPHAFLGQIDGVRVYNTALTKSELDAIWAIPEPRTWALLAASLVILGVAYRRRR